MTPRARRWLLFGAWVVATALLVVALRALGWDRTAAVLSRARAPWLAAAALANLSLIALWAWQTRVLLPPDARVSFRRLLDVTALSTTATNSVPPLLGKAAGVALLAERGGVGAAVALSVLAQHQMVEGVAKAVMILAASRVAPLPPWMRDALVFMCVGASALAVGLVVLARRSARWGEALSTLRSPSRLALGLAIALAMKGVEALAWVAVERSLGVSPAPGSPLLALAAVNLASSAGFSPGNLGVYEAAGYLAYVSLGTPREVATALALVGHACYLVPLVGAGWVLLTSVHVRKAVTGDS